LHYSFTIHYTNIIACDYNQEMRLPAYVVILNSGVGITQMLISNHNALPSLIFPLSQSSPKVEPMHWLCELHFFVHNHT